MIAIDTNTCTGCRHCADVCPHRVIDVVNRTAQLTHVDRCIECGACALNCQYDAIEVTKGAGCLFLIVRDDILGLGGDGKQGDCC